MSFGALKEHVSVGAEEVSHPPKVAEPPFVLKPLLNGALVCRSRYSTEGHEAPSEDIFRAMKKWDRLSNGKSTQQSVVLKGNWLTSQGKQEFLSTQHRNNANPSAALTLTAVLLFVGIWKTDIHRRLGPGC